MTLQEKLINLKLNAALAVKHANGWQRLIDLYGESKATEFYKHLGFNHLGASDKKRVPCQGCDGKHKSCARCHGNGYIEVDVKSFDWEGLTLSREPKEHEKLAVKGIAQAQESSKGAIGKILLDLRGELIADGLKGIKKLKPARYHELTLQASPEIRLSLRDRLIKVYQKGRRLLDSELADQGLLSGKSTPHDYLAMKDDAIEGEFDDLDLLTDLTNSRVANDVQARIIAAAQRYALLGQTGNDLLTSITSEITDGSVAYIDRAATGLANRVISIGRSDEAQNRSDEWERVEYSALLDQNVCDPCASFDGESSTDEADLEPAPSPSCLGGDFCRCFHVFITN
jgi:hypothetical protein